MGYPKAEPKDVYRNYNKLIIIPKLLEIDKEIVREFARNEKYYLKKSADNKAQISIGPASGTNVLLILRSLPARPPHHCLTHIFQLAHNHIVYHIWTELLKI